MNYTQSNTNIDSTTKNPKDVLISRHGLQEKKIENEECEEEELEEEEDDELDDKNKQNIQKPKNIPISKTPITPKTTFSRLNNK